MTRKEKSVEIEGQCREKAYSVIENVSVIEFVTKLTLFVSKSVQMNKFK
jgi:hypothetical protein